MTAPPSLLTCTEKAWMQTVVSAARMLGWHTYHTHDSRRSDKGFPDLVLVHPDHGLIFAELKTEKGRVRPEQWEWIWRLEKAGERVFVWRPSYWDEVQAVLNGWQG